jgi:hypothetical protein
MYHVPCTMYSWPHVPCKLCSMQWVFYIDYHPFEYIYVCLAYCSKAEFWILNLESTFHLWDRLSQAFESNRDELQSVFFCIVLYTVLLISSVGTSHQPPSTGTHLFLSIPNTKKTILLTLSPLHTIFSSVFNSTPPVSCMSIIVC